MRAAGIAFRAATPRPDIAVLAQVDEAHETWSDPATGPILQREFYEYGRRSLSGGPRLPTGICTGLGTKICRPEICAAVHVIVSGSGDMKKARSIRLVLANVENRTRTDPAFCGSDAVHPGDSTDGKGVYHVNAVDEVTQCEIAAAAPRISEALEPALTAVLAQFPFVIHGFHPDNRSEFINQTVAKVLNELMIEQTNPGRPYPAVLHGPTSTPT